MSLTKPMLRELLSLHHDGQPTDPVEWQNVPDSLWVACRDRTIGALLRRGLIVAGSDYTLTDAGRAALAKAGGAS